MAAIRSDGLRRTELADEMLRLAAATRAAFTLPHQSSKLHARNLQVLLALYISPGAGPAEIGETLGVPRSSVSAAFDILLEQKLVAVRPNPDDGRKTLRRLSERGLQMAERLADHYLDSGTRSL